MNARENTNTAIIMIGIQGSGKSEYVRQILLPEGYVHISLDLLHTRRKEKLLLDQCLSEGRSFVIDNTNPTIESRKGYIQAAKEQGYQVVGIFMQSILRDCIARNNQRDGKQRLQEKAIVATSNKLELPDYKEGYDELYFVKITDGLYIKDKWVRKDEL